MPASKKSPYGDVDYADDGLQDDGVKRYPLDTAEHVKAAASYFGMEKNRSKYSAYQQKTIDSKIAAAKKKFDISDKGGVVSGEPPLTIHGIDAVVQAAIAAVLNDVAVTKGTVIATKSDLEGASSQLLSVVKTALTEQQAGIEKGIADMKNALLETIEERIKDATSKANAIEPEVNALKASVNAMVGAARTATAIGGLPALSPDGTSNKAAMLERGEVTLPEIRPTDPATGKNGAIGKLLRAQRV
jgi:hypothetical protein